MDRRIVKTKQSIQSAYFELLQEKNRKKITISEVARKANIDRKTFYLHYDTVDEITREFCRDKVKELMELLRAGDFPRETFSIRELFEILNKLVADNLTAFKILSSQGEYHYFTDQIKELLVTEIVNTYTESFPFSASELQLYAEFYISGIISVYVKWIREHMPFTLDELASRISTASFRGLERLISQEQLH